MGIIGFGVGIMLVLSWNRFIQKSQPGGIIALLALIILALSLITYFNRFAGIRIAITSPKDGEVVMIKCDPSFERCSFPISGTSESLKLRTELKSHVLIHIVSPWSKEWLLQEEPVKIKRNGTWITRVWLNRERYVPRDGDIIEIVAIVIAKGVHIEPNKGILNLEDLKFITQSDVIHNVKVKIEHEN